MPTFTIEHIDKYYEKVNNAFSQNSTKVKKHFHRGEQLLEESFIDVGSVVVKENLSFIDVGSVVVKENLSFIDVGSVVVKENLSFIDVGSVVVKENLSLFCIKGVCAASMKNMNRWVTVAISKFPVEVYFAYCQCAAGKPDIC